MIVLYYDLEKYCIDEVQSVFNYIKENVRDEVIALPKEFDILLDCSIDQLTYIKTRIEEAIKAKEQINEM